MHLSLDHIYAYVDGALDAAAETLVEEHTADCGACRAMLAEEIAFQNTLRGSIAANGIPNIPDEFLSATVARARTDVTGLTRPRNLAVAVLLVLTLLALAVAAANWVPANGIFGSAVGSALVVAGYVGRMIVDIVFGVAVVGHKISASLPVAAQALIGSAFLLIAGSLLGDLFVFSHRRGSMHETDAAG